MSGGVGSLRSLSEDGVNAVDDGDGNAGGGGVEFDGALDGFIFLVPGGGLGDADQIFEGGVVPEAGVVDEDGFAVEEAGGPGGLES